MALLELYAGEDALIPSGSGIGFFGNDGFNAAIVVGSYNGRTFATDSSGVVENFECNNNQYNGTSGVIHGQTGSGISLVNLPNELSTINIRFTHGTSVFTQNIKFHVFDGSFTGGLANKTIPVPNLTFLAAEIRHRDRLQTTSSPYSDTSWSNLSTSGSNFMNLINSPGSQGLREGGFEEFSARHDWYLALSCTPTQLGDKQFGMTLELEYI